MKRYVAFLRGINVSGQKLIKMEALKAMFISMKFADVVTYIQSGNVAFSMAKANDEKLQNKIEKQIIKTFSYEVVVTIRSREELEGIIANSPLKDDPEHSRKLYVTMLSEEPDKVKYESLKAFLKDGEEMECINKEIYFVSEAYGETKLSNTFIEKKLGLDATTRNWATMNKMAAL
jgi:uncharacterized protein (DUF1697 family)